MDELLRESNFWKVEFDLGCLQVPSVPRNSGRSFIFMDDYEYDPTKNQKVIAFDFPYYEYDPKR